MTFKEEEIRERFLKEFIRVKDSAAFFTDQEFCHSLGRHRNWISQLTGPPPIRYTISTKDLFYAAALWGFDIRYIVLGGAKAHKLAMLPTLEELKHRGQYKRTGNKK